jgi:hypothetical protein
MATAFVLVQPAMQASYSELSSETLPVGGYDDCSLRSLYDDPISQNTIKKGDVAKTIHAEKEVFDCFTGQGNLEIIVDVTTYIEVFYNITTGEILEASAFATTCLKNEPDGSLIDCESYEVATSLVPVGVNCSENTDIDHPQEMNTVNKGNSVLTVESQKEVFNCSFTDGTQKKVDLVIFTAIPEDIRDRDVDADPLTSGITFLEARCVVVVTSDSAQDARVEGCTFNETQN